MEKRLKINCWMEVEQNPSIKLDLFRETNTATFFLEKGLNIALHIATDSLQFSNFIRNIQIVGWSEKPIYIYIANIQFEYIP